MHCDGADVQWRSIKRKVRSRKPPGTPREVAQRAGLQNELDQAKRKIGQLSAQIRENDKELRQVRGRYDQVGDGRLGPVATADRQVKRRALLGSAAQAVDHASPMPVLAQDATRAHNIPSTRRHPVDQGSIPPMPAMNQSHQGPQPFIATPVNRFTGFTGRPPSALQHSDHHGSSDSGAQRNKGGASRLSSRRAGKFPCMSGETRLMDSGTEGIRRIGLHNLELMNNVTAVLRPIHVLYYTTCLFNCTMTAQPLHTIPIASRGSHGPLTSKIFFPLIFNIAQICLFATMILATPLLLLPVIGRRSFYAVINYTKDGYGRLRK